MLAPPHSSSDVSLAFAVLLVAVLVPATAIDLRERRIPNALTGAGAIVAGALGLTFDPSGQLGRTAAAVGAVGFLLLVRLPRPDGLGLGDVKLTGVLGLCLGPEVAVALVLAFAAGSVVAVVVLAGGGRRALRTATVPFGPYLAGGAVAALVAGDPLLAAYVGVLQA